MKNEDLTTYCFIGAVLTISIVASKSLGLWTLILGLFVAGAMYFGHKSLQS